MNIIKHIEVTSESDFCSRHPSPDTSVISITNFRSMEHPSDGWAKFLPISFNDIDDTQIPWHKKLVCAVDDMIAPIVGERLNPLIYGNNPWCNRPFSKGDAGRILRWLDTVDTSKLLIHCEFGRSRSVAVAQCVALGDKAAGAELNFLIKGISPNLRVRRLLLSVMNAKPSN